MDNKKSEEILSDNKLQTTECSVKESVKPLIEVISECSTTSKNSEQISSEQKEIKQSHGSQTTSCCKQKDVSIIYNIIIYKVFGNRKRQNNKGF